MATMAANILVPVPMSSLAQHSSQLVVHNFERVVHKIVLVLLRNFVSLSKNQPSFGFRCQIVREVI